MTLRTNRILAIVLGLGTAYGTMAQIPIQPLWQHTWPYGMDNSSLMSYLPPWKDNRVVVDPITGLVHATVSDENMLFSPRSEFFHSFSAEGIELTGSPTPLLGTVPLPGLYGTSFNTIGLLDLHVYDGKVFSAHTNRLAGMVHMFDWPHFYEGGPFGNDRWHLTIGHSSPMPEGLCLTTGADRVVFGRYGLREIYGTSHDGRMIWRSQLPSWPTQLVSSDDIAFALVGNMVHRINMLNGTELSPDTPVPFTTERIAVKGNFIYHVRTVDNTDVVVGKRSLDGQSLWEQSFTIAAVPVLTGLVVDGSDRVWITCLRDDFTIENLNGGYLLGVDANGAALGTYTYGAALHSLATDGNTLFLTGWSTNTGTETFLIAVNPSLITGYGEQVDLAQQLLNAWPNPASRNLHVRTPPQVDLLELLDTQGRLVRSWQIGSSASLEQVDISDLATGRYSLRASGMDIVLHTAVMITR